MAKTPAKVVSDIAAEVASQQQLQADAELARLQQQLQADAELARLRSEAASLRAKYKAALEQIDRERERADRFTALQGVTPRPLTKSVKARKAAKHPATAILMLSDIHCEERVLPETVNAANDYSLDVCQLRMAELQERFLACLEHERNQADIRRVLVWLGGDFITGHIHPDCVEVAQLSPMNATRWIADRLRGLIDSVAQHADEVVVCTNAGNHGRSTEKNRIATELEHCWRVRRPTKTCDGRSPRATWDTWTSTASWFARPTGTASATPAASTGWPCRRARRLPDGTLASVPT